MYTHILVVLISTLSVVQAYGQGHAPHPAVCLARPVQDAMETNVADVALKKPQASLTTFAAGESSACADTQSPSILDVAIRELVAAWNSTPFSSSLSLPAWHVGENVTANGIYQQDGTAYGVPAYPGYSTMAVPAVLVQYRLPLAALAALWTAQGAFKAGTYSGLKSCMLVLALIAFWMDKDSE